jgi:hypothetical protein
MPFRPFGELAYVVAPRLNLQRNLFADFDNSLVSLAPASRKYSGRDQSPFLHDKQIASATKINVHQIALSTPLILSPIERNKVAQRQHNVVVINPLKLPLASA